MSIKRILKPCIKEAVEHCPDVWETWGSEYHKLTAATPAKVQEATMQTCKRVYYPCSTARYLLDVGLQL